VIGLAGTVYGVGFLWADHNFGQAMGSFQAGEPLVAKDQIEKALSFRPDVLYQASLAAELKDAALEGDGTDRALFESANEAFSYLRSTPLVFGLVNHAQLLDHWGEDRGDDQDQAAIGLYDQAIEIDALNPLIRAESARVHIEIGDNQGAVDVLDDAVPYVGRDSKYAEFWGLLALAHARLGDEGPAIEAISVALAANPGEVNALRAQEILDRS
jgi:predicted Zn-dependent protease